MPPARSGASSPGLSVKRCKAQVQGAKIPGTMGEGVNHAPAPAGAQVGRATAFPFIGILRRRTIAAAASLSLLSVVGKVLRLRAARI